MEPLGWLVMISSISSVLAMTGFCLFRVFTLPPVEVDDLTSPLEIDTRDTRNAD